MREELGIRQAEDINGGYLVETSQVRIISFTVKEDEKGGINFSLTVKDAAAFRRFLNVLKKNEVNYQLDRDSQSIISNTSIRVHRNLPN